MIISHSNKFVYTRPMKVGSTSVQHMLHNSELVSDTDISTGCVDNVYDKGFLEVQGLSIPNTRMEAIDFKVNLIHSTPEELYSCGLITGIMLEEYTFISIIRNPIERFISAWVMEVIGGFYIGNSYEKFISMLEERDFPYMLAYDSPDMYFKFQGTLLPKTIVLQTKTLLADLMQTFPGTDFTPQWFKKTKYPEWYSRDYRKFLSSKHLNIIKEFMATEVVFYEEVTGEKIC